MINKLNKINPFYTFLNNCNQIEALSLKKIIKKMGKIIVALALMIASFSIEAQVKIPQASPKSVVSQTVGLTDVEINYHRPSARNRVVFGDLVPFGKVWRTGANENTTISFNEDVVINGTTLKKENMRFTLLQKRIVGTLFFIQILLTGEIRKNGMRRKWL